MATQAPSYTTHEVPPPPYTNPTETKAIELNALTPNQQDTLSPARTSTSSDYSASLLPYSPPTISGPFTPTQVLRIETPGKPLFGLPLPPKPDPIPVYDVSHGVSTSGDVAPLYVSVRKERGSGTCSLVDGEKFSFAQDSSSSLSNAGLVPLCTTTYRFGLGNPPVLTMKSIESDALPIEITSPSAIKRTVTMRTPHGTFRWRYATRSERKEMDVPSLLLLERIHMIYSASSSKQKAEEKREVVGRFIRSDATRSAGSRRSTAGNGGILELDLRSWIVGEADVKGGGEVEEVRLLAVASCICMLKREVDRRRLHQAMMIGAIIGGAS